MTIHLSTCMASLPVMGCEYWIEPASVNISGAVHWKYVYSSHLYA